MIARRTFQTVLAAALGPAHVVFSVDPGRGAIPGDHHKLPVVKNSFLDVSIVKILVHRGLLGFSAYFITIARETLKKGEGRSKMIA